MFSKKRSDPAPAKAIFKSAAGFTLDKVTVTGFTGSRNVTILQNMSIQMRSSRIAVLGLNGSGKSTFLKLFNGLVTPDSGRVEVGGIAVHHHLSTVRQLVGLLFADPQAQLIMPTPVEDVELSLQRTLVHPAKRRAQAIELLAQQGLADRAESSVYDLSGGERQLAALTSLLAVKPRVLLLDEPTTLLDLRNKLRLVKLLDDLPQHLIIGTHDLDLAATCSEAVVIHRGSILAHGPAATVIEHYRHWCASRFPPLPQHSDRDEV